ncbi:MAG: C1 family peptidase [Pseudomonadota bacterium]
MPDFPRLGKYQLTAIADTPDFRDFTYQPALIPLDEKLDPPGDLDILDQESEGACTGFGLAAVINLLRDKSGRPGHVSARMLYEMARHHDEWPGYDYEGSSCRGAILGWYNMGVCLEDSWPYEDNNPGHLTVACAKEARSTTVGAYYRLGTRISDFHAALNEVGAIYCSADVHDGWEKPRKRKGVHTIKQHDEIVGGHAFAIVGYNDKGFWVQNSWGERWGNKGVALWLYEDWQKNLSDAWVFRQALETPQVWHLPTEGSSDAGRTEGLIKTTPSRAEIAGHFVHLDDGNLHTQGRYWSTIEDVRETAELVANSNYYEHLLLYAHGGLNSVKASARRISAMKDTFLDNKIYPYHFMYDTGLLEEIKDVVFGSDQRSKGRVGNITNWTDKLIEQGSQFAGRAIWRQMKKGARRPFNDGRDGTLVLNEFLQAMSNSGKPKHIHLVGHSTGCILHSYLAAALLKLDPTLRISSASMMAPAGTVDLYQSHFRPLLKTPGSQGGIDRMDIYNLTGRLERDDSVGPYRKSLLYLVSRSFEDNPLPARLLGMRKYSKHLASSVSRLNIYYSDGTISGSATKTASKTHGGFDNDKYTMNSVLKRVTGKSKPDKPFTKKSLKY